MKNHLAGETSPYLLQHAENPVDWFPWGEEAFTRARELDKPILLSVGYAACHWCHVMAHESFEDPNTAEIMNEHFVNVKVDREERPDVDTIYMDAVVAMNGQGGWPMTVVMTPAGNPFFGGTYYPPVPRHGLPSFKQVLVSIAQAWQERRDDIDESAASITRHIGQAVSMEKSSELLQESVLDDALTAITGLYDRRMGGFGSAPKFPQSMAIEFLLKQYARRGDSQALQMAEHTLEMMARGGMYDQIGGGFARYSTDNNWLVPHFEKMLYDNALLSRAYLHAWQITGNPLYRRVVEETLDWVLTEMGHEDGGFYSSLDADSEGVEGKFYVWGADEIDNLLGPDSSVFKQYYGVTEGGNWEGANVLYMPGTIENVAESIQVAPEEIREKLLSARQKVFMARARRPRPALDDKVITAWNGMMLAAFAEAGRDLKQPRFTEAAEQNAEFLYNNMRLPNGRLFRTWKAGGSAKNNGFLEDYAFLADGLIALYQSTFDSRWFNWAADLARIMLEFFQDERGGGFFDTSHDHEALLYRPKGVQDNAIPSGNSAAVRTLLLLSLYTGNNQYWDVAEATISSMIQYMSQYPTGFGHWLNAADLILSQPLEIAIVGEQESADTKELIEAALSQYRPNQVVAVGFPRDGIPLLSGRTLIDGRSAAYVCRNFTCDLPVTEASQLEEKLL